MSWTRLTTVLLAAALAGCASNALSAVLADGPRMIDLYRGTAAPERGSAPEEPATPVTGARCRWWLFDWPCEAPEAPASEPEAEAGRDAASYTRTASNELELLFPRLPNPDIYIHVLPHLATEERVPVPGYTTAVPLYERVEYALPGELERAPENGTPDREHGTPEDGEAR